MKFDLEKSLLGHLVLLRDGTHGLVMFDARRNALGVAYEGQEDLGQLIGMYADGQRARWTPNGVSNMAQSRPERDIIGMATYATFQHWGVIDSKWRFVSADNNGMVYLYENRPRRIADNQWTPTTGDHRNITGVFDFTYTDWTCSLLERPS